jgi:hypothetical protein
LIRHGPSLTAGFQGHPFDRRIDPVTLKSVVTLELSDSRIGRLRARDLKADKQGDQEEELARAFHIRVSQQLCFTAAGTARTALEGFANSSFSRPKEVIAARGSLSRFGRRHAHTIRVIFSRARTDSGKSCCACRSTSSRKVSVWSGSWCVKTSLLTSARRAHSMAWR